MFYTYAHYTPQRRLFYIGKGSSERRAHRMQGRNNYWNKIVTVVRECAKGNRKSHKGFTWVKESLENK